MIFDAGTKLGRYEIRSKLGEGGMGEVYRARDPKINRDVAIKVLPSTLSSDRDRVARFEQEAQAAWSPDGRFIVFLHRGVKTRITKDERVKILDLGANYHYARQPDQAIAQLGKAIDLDKNWYLAHMVLCQVYEAKGQLSEAVNECQKARALNDDPLVMAFLARAYATSGKKDEAMKLLGQMNEIGKQRYLPAYGFAVAYGGLGNKDQAFQWLERSLQDRAWDITFLKVDPLMDNLHSDPRFADLVRRVGL